MRYPIRLALSIAMAGGLAALPSWGATNNKRKQSTEDQGVQEAIRFERAKQAAADRQARIEAQRNSNSADRSALPQPSARHVPKSKKHSTGSAARQKQP